MTKRKKKIKKIIKYPLLLILIIIVSYTSITLCKRFIEKQNNFDIPNFNSYDKYEQKFKDLNYSNEDLKILKSDVSQENKNYLLENNIEKDLAMGFINEKYYIDDYLKKYLTYYEKNQNLNKNEIVTRINTHLDDEFYNNTEKANDTLGKFVILNKHYYSDNNYKGKDLVDVSNKYHIWGYNFQLSKECYEAFLKMYEDAKNAGFAFKINSAYRSYETQIKIYQGWVNQDGQKLADTYSARAGHSEHQTGYAFDVRDYPYTTDDYGKTASFTWVSKNAYKYGFIIRFPENKEYITGYQYEPWHYRYCGLECAKYIHDNDITFEEYYEYFIKYQNPRNLK